MGHQLRCVQGVFMVAEGSETLTVGGLPYGHDAHASNCIFWRA